MWWFGKRFRNVEGRTIFMQFCHGAGAVTLLNANATSIARPPSRHSQPNSQHMRAQPPSYYHFRQLSLCHHEACERPLFFVLFLCVCVCGCRNEICKRQMHAPFMHVSTLTIFTATEIFLFKSQMTILEQWIFCSAVCWPRIISFGLFGRVHSCCAEGKSWLVGQALISQIAMQFIRHTQVGRRMKVCHLFRTALLPPMDGVVWRSYT